MNEEPIKQPAILQRIESLNELVDKLDRKLSPILNQSPMKEPGDKETGESQVMVRLSLLGNKLDTLINEIDIN